MQIVYCEKCGLRIADDALSAGQVTEQENGTYICQQCAPPTASGRFGRKTRARIVPAASREKRSSAIIKPLPRDPEPQLPSDSSKTMAAGRRRPAPVRAGPDGKSVALLLSVVGGVLLAIAGLMLMSGSSTPPATSSTPGKEKSSTPTQSPAQTPPTLKSTPDPVTDPVRTPDQPAGLPPRQVDNHAADQEATAAEAFAKVKQFEGLAADDLAGRRQALENFARDHAGTRAGADAHKLLSDMATVDPMTKTVRADTPPESTVTAPPPAENDAPLEGAQWIWHPDLAKGLNTPGGTCYFRRAFKLPDNRRVRRAALLLTGDNRFTLFCNGIRAGTSAYLNTEWKSGFGVDLAPWLRSGDNTLAVAVENTQTGSAGFIARLRIFFDQGEPLTLRTDEKWLTADRAEQDWTKPGFADDEWKPARGQGAYGAAPWLSQVKFVSKLPADPPAEARFVKQDGAISGEGLALYGSEGYLLPGFAVPVGKNIEADKFDLIRLPPYVAKIDKTGHKSYRFAGTATDPRGLPDADGRLHPITADIGTEFRYTLRFKDRVMHRVAMYFVDGDRVSRSQSMYLLDASSKLLLDRQDLKAGGFHEGQWLIWDVRGDIEVVFKVYAGHNALVSAVCFGPAPDPVMDRTIEDLVAAQAAWQGGTASDLHADTAVAVRDLVITAQSYREALEAAFSKAGAQKELTLATTDQGEAKGTFFKAAPAGLVLATTSGDRTIPWQALTADTWAQLDGRIDPQRLPAPFEGRVALNLLNGSADAPLPAGQAAPALSSGLALCQTAHRMLQGAQINRDAWTEIEKLLAARNYGDFLEKAEAFLERPPSGRLMPDLRKAIDAAMTQARKREEQSFLMDLRSSLKVRPRKLPDGRFEFNYDFSSPQQLYDFNRNPSNIITYKPGYIEVEKRSIDPDINLRGDLEYSFEAMIPSDPCNRIHLYFYDFRGEFGAGDNEWTGMWRAVESYRSPRDRQPKLLVKKGFWHKIHVTYTETEKRVKVTIDDTEALNFVDPRAQGYGKVTVGSQNLVRIRNLVIRGHLDARYMRLKKKREVFSKELAGKLNAGQLTPVFTNEDMPYWVHSPLYPARIKDGVVTVEHSLSLPGLNQVANYEFKAQVRRVGGDDMRFYMRMDGNHDYVMVWHKDKWLETRRYDLADKKHVKIKQVKDFDSSKWHTVHIQSLHNRLRVTIDGETVVMNAEDVSPKALGLSFANWKGGFEIKNAEARYLR